MTAFEYGTANDLLLQMPGLCSVKKSPLFNDCMTQVRLLSHSPYISNIPPHSSISSFAQTLQHLCTEKTCRRLSCSV